MCLAMATRLAGVGGPQLARSTDFQRRVNGSTKLTSDSSPATRAFSGNYCSSSGGISQSRSVIVAPVVRSNGRNGIRRHSAGRSWETEQRNAGRNIAANSLGDDEDFISSHDESPNGIPQSPSPSDIGRSQPIVQGFADNPFVKEFAMDLTRNVSARGAGLAGVGSECESLPAYQPKWIWFADSAEQENLFIDRGINAVILASAGMIALTKVLTVDHDYWHGWTLREILQYAPMHNWFAYESLLKTQPVLAKMMISGTVYSLGDWIAQCYEGKSVLEFNRVRMLRSGFVGFCLHGSLSHFYYQFCEWLFPFQGWWVLPLKVGFDQTIWSGIWNSIYFITVGLLRLESPVTIVQELRQTFFPLLTAGWKLWPFAHLVTYGLVPVEQRVLWVDMVEIIWVCILAMYSNEKAEARIAEAEFTEMASGVEIVAASANEVGQEDKIS